MHNVGPSGRWGYERIEGTEGVGQMEMTRDIGNYGSEFPAETTFRDGPRDSLRRPRETTRGCPEVETDPTEVWWTLITNNRHR